MSRLQENAGTPGTVPSAAKQNRDLFAVPGNVTHKDSWTPNTLTKQGTKLTATWEDAWDDLAQRCVWNQRSNAQVESKSKTRASVLAGPVVGNQGSIGT